MNNQDPRTPTKWAGGRMGLWLVGAHGSVATTAVVGLTALSAGLAEPTGLVTAGKPFADVPLPGPTDIVIGGHDVGGPRVREKARLLAESGMLPPRLVDAIADRLGGVDAEIRALPPVSRGSQETEIELRAADIREFRERNELERVVVIDVASTEPLPVERPEFHNLQALRAAITETGNEVLPSSSISALAAVDAGAAYACFTPSASLSIPSVRQWVSEASVPIAGQDGKTGETLLRTVLAPMFSARAMRVHSWAGTNLLGGGDGATLAEPMAVQSKLASKNRGLLSILGTEVATPLHIDNVPDLGDVKTAWDHVHAEGFLGSRITLQTTWSAYDSMLAAPLVLDLARLLALAHVAGERGVVPELGFFFKDPWGSDVHAFATQSEQLLAWAHDVGARIPYGRAA